MVESTRYSLTLVLAGRSICRRIASPWVVREKCEFSPRATGNSRDPKGGTSSWIVSEQTGVKSAAGRSLFGTEYSTPRGIASPYRCRALRGIDQRDDPIVSVAHLAGKPGIFRGPRHLAIGGAQLVVGQAIGCAAHRQNRRELRQGNRFPDSHPGAGGFLVSCSLYSTCSPALRRT